MTLFSKMASISNGFSKECPHVNNIYLKMLYIQFFKKILSMRNGYFRKCPQLVMDLKMPSIITGFSNMPKLH